nr:MAG TPA: hypothetical protein [Caudoviricetes sp.]
MCKDKPMNVIKNTLSNVGVFFLLSIKEVYTTLESPFKYHTFNHLSSVL